jgi:serine/threonine-protein kinase
MDWGIAKKIGVAAEAEGEVIGTPLYMSPEQARGENGSIDARSDLFSASVVFHELLTLDHYLPEYHDIKELVRSVGSRGWRNSMLAWHRSTQRPMPPMELYHFLRRGLQLDLSKRYQTAEGMMSRLQALLEGRVPVQCHITFIKSAVRRTGRIVDRHPWLSFVAFTSMIGMAGAGLVSLFV